MCIRDRGYTLRETEANLTGVTDTTATAEAKSYEGFRFDEDNENNVLTGVITGDGKLVLKVYYARNSYEVSYDYGAAPTGASQLPGTVSYKYGAEVRVADKALSLIHIYTVRLWRWRRPPRPRATRSAAGARKRTSQCPPKT